VHWEYRCGVRPELPDEACGRNTIDARVLEQTVEGVKARLGIRGGRTGSPPGWPRPALSVMIQIKIDNAFLEFLEGARVRILRACPGAR
jgi:hypothetical protein